jgi:hypothetical protein
MWVDLSNQGRIAKTDNFDKQIGVNMKNEPAFPFTEMHTHGTPYTQWKGMTLRDYFAAKAMQAFLNEVGWAADQKWFDGIAEGAYRMADAMLKARGE